MIVDDKSKVDDQVDPFLWTKCMVGLVSSSGELARRTVDLRSSPV